MAASCKPPSMQKIVGTDPDQDFEKAGKALSSSLKQTDIFPDDDAMIDLVGEVPLDQWFLDAEDED